MLCCNLLNSYVIIGKSRDLNSLYNVNLLAVSILVVDFSVRSCGFKPYGIDSLIRRKAEGVLCIILRSSCACRVRPAEEALVRLSRDIIRDRKRYGKGIDSAVL